MNANERNEMEKPMEANILPDAVDANVTVTEDEKIIAENNHTNELIENDLIVSEIIEDEEDNEESETDYDFSACNKLQLIEILEETVQDTDVVKIKDKVTAIKSNFLRLNKEDRDREMEQFILDGGDKDSYEHVEDPLAIRFRDAFDISRNNKERYNEFTVDLYTHKAIDQETFDDIRNNYSKDKRKDDFER